MRQEVCSATCVVPAKPSNSRHQPRRVTLRPRRRLLITDSNLRPETHSQMFQLRPEHYPEQLPELRSPPPVARRLSRTTFGRKTQLKDLARERWIGQLQSQG